MGLKAVANLGGGGGGTVTGSGTPGTLAKFTGAGTSIGDSLLSESVTTITSAATAETFTNAQTWTVGAPNSQALVVLSNAGLERTLVLDTISRAVGVGVPTTPATLLHVSDGVTAFAGTTGAGVRLDRATEALFSSSDGTRSLRAGLTGGTAVVGTSTAHDLLLQRGNVTAATLTSGAIATLTLTGPGAGYTNGTYSQQPLTGGTGSGATADFVVAGGIITSCVLRSPGTGYTAADALSCATLGAGAGLVVTVATISQVVEGSGNVTALGRIGAGTATPQAGLDVAAGGANIGSYSDFVRSTGFTSNTKWRTGLFMSPSIVAAGTSSSFNAGIALNPTFDFSGITGTTSGFGVSATATLTASAAGQSANLTGGSFAAQRNNASDLSTVGTYSALTANASVASGVGATTTATLYGINSVCQNTVSGHTVTTLAPVNAQPYAAAGAIVGTGYGVNVTAVTTASTWTTFYGLRLQAWSSATVTNRWGISQEDTLASNQFSAVTNTFSGIVRATGSTAGAPAFSTPADTDTGMYFPSANTVRIATNGTVGLEVDSSQNLKFNSGFGSATTAYGCRAWVNFIGATAVIRGSGGVSSLTRASAGTYTINYTTAMPDINYSAVATKQSVGSNADCQLYDLFASRTTTSSAWINVEGGAVVDSANINLAFFR